MSFNLIILGAGAPHRGEQPAALRELRDGTSMLQWFLDACGCSMDAVTFVSGYQSDVTEHVTLS